MRKRTLARAAIAALVGLSGVASAADYVPLVSVRPGPYLGVEGGSATIDAGTVDGIPLSASSFTYGVLAGYQFNRFIGLEAQYIKVNQATTTVNVLDVPVELGASFHGYGVSAVGTLPLVADIGLYARVGVVKGYDTLSASLPGTGLAVSEGVHGSKGIYGAGAYIGNGHSIFRLEYMRANDVAGVRVSGVVGQVVFPLW